MHSLAIIVPAYKALFLKKTLECMAGQTDKNFSLYVGDDCSPENLRAVCDEFDDTLELHYIRYDKNLGGSDLAAHWERCIDESREPYIWLFSDDDTMPCDAVQRINTAIAARKKAFYRLPLEVIGEQGERIFEAPAFEGENDTALTFLCEKFSGRRPSAAIEFVFARELYLAAGRFVHFPVAWSSDDATWFRYALRAGGIENLPGKAVGWRQSGGANISTNPRLNKEKMRATTLFIKWLHDEMILQEIPFTREFGKNLKKYIKTILSVSLGRKFSTGELWGLCRQIAAFDRRLALKIFLKYVV